MKILSFDIGTANLAYCYVDCIGFVDFNDSNEHIKDHNNIAYNINIIDWDIINLNEKLTKICPYALINLFESKYMHLLDCDIVLIENQPPKNIKMKTIQTIIHTYFTMIHYKNNKIYINDNIMKTKQNQGKYNEMKRNSVYICQPRDKYCSLPPEQRNTYYKRKKMSIQMATKYLEEICANSFNNENNDNNNDDDNYCGKIDDKDEYFIDVNTKYFTQFMDKHKKDDLADSLLQIKVFIEKMVI